MSASFAHPVRPESPTPAMRRNFHHLYIDVAAYGFLAGSAVAFIAIYATRLGASSLQIGLITALPALVSLLVTLPAGQWVGRHNLTPAVFWTSIGQRLLYVLLIPVSLLLAPTLQLWSIILLTLVCSIPGTALAIGFNALLAEAVPPAYRGEVVGRRNALLALTMTASSILSGQLLRLLPIEVGYPLVFAFGSVGAIVSSYHLWRVRLETPRSQRIFEGLPLPDAERVSKSSLIPDAPLSRPFAMRMLLRRPGTASLRVTVAPLRTRYGLFILALFSFHFAQYIPISLFPIFWVREARLSDGTISILNATFYLVMLLASLRLGRLTRRFGNRRLMIMGCFALSAYPLLTGLSQGPTLLFGAALLGGCVWAVLSGALSNRLLEWVPDDNRPTYLALYNLALNAAILGGSLIGSAIADVVGLRETMFIATALRVAAAVLVLRFG